MTADVHTAKENGVLVLQLTRAQKKNAITAAMYADLAAALTAAETDSDVRSVMITGEDGVFTAGNDLADFLANPPLDQSAPVFQFIAALANATLPYVAAVDGPAVGIGTTLLLHCDFVVLTPRARLQLPFVNLGLVPEAGSSYLLPKMLGHARAAELLLLGDPVTAEDAVRLGFANRIVPAEQLQQTALDLAHRLAAKPPAALRASKRLLRQDRDHLLAVMREEARQFAERLVSAEAREAFSAFLEKRAPDFSRSTP